MVAAAVHRLGYPAASWITPPAPPKWYSEWEDREAIEVLLTLAPYGQAPDDDGRAMFCDWLPGYLRRRRAQSVVIDPNARGFACKSPMYSYFVREFTSIGSVRLIQTARNRDGLEKSVRESFARFGIVDKAMETNRLIGGELRRLNSDRLVIEYEKYADSPEKLAETLDRYLGE